MTDKLKSFIEDHIQEIEDNNVELLVKVCPAELFAELYMTFKKAGVPFNYKGDFYTMYSSGYKDYYSSSDSFEDVKHKALNIAGENNVSVSTYLKGKRAPLWAVESVSPYYNLSSSDPYKIARCSDNTVYKLYYKQDMSNKYHYPKYSHYELQD